MKGIGEKCNILESVVISNPDKVSLGKRVSIHQFCYLDGQGEIEIGNDVAIANHVKILTSDHVFKNNDVAIKDQGIEIDKITIKDNVWIGAGATILKGVVIGENSIIILKALPDLFVWSFEDKLIISNGSDSNKKVRSLVGYH